ncbi:hypothetical protein FRAHR75_730002 [Frankia sp. Hr75.2]|nr:hypothetical protein FRAHR75_730002 [Frankia sp. Hr75.2]
MAAHTIQSELGDVASMSLATLRSCPDGVVRQSLDWLVARIALQDERSSDDRNKNRTD